MYTPSESGSMGWSARVSIVYPSQFWFMGVVSQGSYCIPHPNLVRWGGQPGFLSYTPAESGSLGWSPRLSIVYPSQIWFRGVVSQGSYCIMSKLRTRIQIQLGQSGLSTQQLVDQLGFMDNRLLCSNPKVRDRMVQLINSYQDVFTDVDLAVENVQCFE